MEKLNLERDFYTVKDDGTIEIVCWMEERDNNWPGFENDPMPRYTLVTGDWPDMYDTNTDVATWALPYEHYEEDMHYEEAVAWVKDCNTYLPMYKVTKDTPAGYYWCYFNEEPAFN